MKALSFFTGAMGLDIGLERAGIETILASEIDKSASETIKKNKPHLPLIGNLLEYDVPSILSAAGLSKNDQVDLIVGGPPCQAFSTAGKRKSFEDIRGNVFLKFLEVILGIMPRFLVIENVRGLLSAPFNSDPVQQQAKGSALHHILHILERAGYLLSFNLYNTANFGTPQIRERLVIIGALGRKRLSFLIPTHHETGEFGLKKWKTFRNAVEGLPPAKEKDFLPFPEKRLRFYRILKQGQNWRDLPEDLQKEALGNAYYSGGGKTGFYRRLAWDKPSPTLVTHPAMPATDLAHPEEDRPLSIAEYKRVQEFPDDWILCGNVVDQYRQVGNAVPCGLGEAIGRLLMQNAQGKEIQPIKGFSYSRYSNTDHKSWAMVSQDKQLNFPL